MFVRPRLFKLRSACASREFSGILCEKSKCIFFECVMILYFRKFQLGNKSDDNSSGTKCYLYVIGFQVYAK